MLVEKEEEEEEEEDPPLFKLMKILEREISGSEALELLIIIILS